MKRVWMALLVGVAAAACASGEQMTYRELEDLARREQRAAIDRPPPDTCQMAAHQSLIGADAAAIDHSTLPAGTRVICHDCQVTLDYSAARLNIDLGADGKVARLHCG